MIYFHGRLQRVTNIELTKIKQLLANSHEENADLANQIKGEEWELDAIQREL